MEEERGNAGAGTKKRNTKQTVKSAHTDEISSTGDVAKTVKNSKTSSHAAEIPSKSKKRKRSPEPTDRVTRSKKKMSDPEKMSDAADSADSEEDMLDEEGRGITINFTFKQFKKHISAELRKNRKEIAADNDKTIAKIAGDLEKTKIDLGKHKKETKTEFQKIKQQLDKLSENASTEKEVGELVRKEVEKRGIEVQKTTSDSTESERKAYWWSRKCLKLWPIPGEGKEEMGKFLELFVRTKLKIPTGVLVDEDVKDIRRCRLTRGQQAKSEALVVFADVESRDLVASYARNLAPFVDAQNKPTAGLRPDVPGHLGGVHRTLVQYGYAMKKRYGPHFRRNIRFEDSDLSLVVDVCIPAGGKPGKEWTTVDYQRAKEDRKANNRVNLQEQGNKLSSRGEEPEVGDAEEAAGGGPEGGARAKNKK